MIDLEVDAVSPPRHEARWKMCDRLLANPLIESYEIELEDRSE